MVTSSSKTEEIEWLITALEDAFSKEARNALVIAPIAEGVPFAQEFKTLMEEKGGQLWGPQATPRSKVATVLHFAGWSRQQMEECGLKPKDVENFRRKYKLTAGATGRPKNPSVPSARKRGLFGGTEPVDAIRHKRKALEDEVARLERQIQADTERVHQWRQEIKKLEEAMKVISS